MSNLDIKTVTWDRLLVIRDLPNQTRNATLAAFRRETDGYPKRDSEQSMEEWVVRMAIALYAIHQLEHPFPGEDMNRKNFRLGVAVRKLADANGGVPYRHVARRFNSLVTEPDVAQRIRALKGIIRLLSAENIPLDYPQLAEDLYGLSSSQTAFSVMKRWGEDFCGVSTREEESEQQKEFVCDRSGHFLI